MALVKMFHCSRLRISLVPAEFLRSNKGDKDRAQKINRITHPESEHTDLQACKQELVTPDDR